MIAVTKAALAGCLPAGGWEERPAKGVEEGTLGKAARSQPAWVTKVAGMLTKE